jgi:DNA polymerase-3 subunit delta'
MTWSRTIGQESIKKVLQKQIIDGRIPHAYCFWGDEGTGKEATAIEFAKTVNCENPIVTDNTIEYCGECGSCKMFDKLSHPNIEIIFAMPKTKSNNSDSNLSGKQIDEIGTQLKLKSENYYHKIEVKGGNQILIDSIRKLKKTLSLSQVSRGRRVVIVSRADEMTVESANAFLKTLEEPHENVTIILTTSRKELLLPTILSRCQTIHFPGLSRKTITEYLIEVKNIDSNEAELAAAFSQGSITRSLDFLNDDMRQLRELAVAMLRTALTKKGYKINLSKSIEELTKDKSKRKIEMFLNILLLWLRDVEIFRNTEDKDRLVNIDHQEVFQRFIKTFGKSDIKTAIETVENSIARIKKNMPLNLLLLSMFIEIRSVLYNNNDI